MNSLIRQLMRSGGGIPGMEMITGNTHNFSAPISGPGPESCGCGPDPFSLLRVAIIVKYGANVREAAFKFTEEADAIMKRHAVDNAYQPTLTEKLEALKVSVGEATYDKLLANPEVERMAARAYRKATEGKSNEALTEITALFNNAIPADQLAFVLNELSQLDNPVEVLVES